MILLAVNILFLLYLLETVIVLIDTALTTTVCPVFPPQGFTLQWFHKFLSMTGFTDAVKRSALLATSSTMVATALGTLSALALARYRFRGREAISALMLSPILFPTIVLGLALLVFYSEPTISAISTMLIVVWMLIGVPIYTRFLSIKHH